MFSELNDGNLGRVLSIKNYDAMKISNSMQIKEQPHHQRGKNALKIS